MNKFNKTLLAAALMVAAGSANAAITANNTSADQAFLVVYDSAFVNGDLSLGVTYNRNLGVTFAQLAAATDLSLLNTTITGDSNWTTFTAGMTSSAKWAVFDGSLADHGAFVTGNQAPLASINDASALIFDAAATRINQHAVEINSGLTGVSSLIKQTPDNSTGQGEHAELGLPFASVWTGVNPSTGFNALTAFGGVANFYKGGFHVGAFDDGFDIVQANLTTQSDITEIGKLTLTAAGLSAVPATVPLPAAVWMFGAGLMGVLRLNRRKSAQA